MHAIRAGLLVALFGVGAAAGAQTSAPAKSAPVQPALAALAAPRASDLYAAGVQKVAARTGMQRRDIQILTSYGTSYIPWPKGVTPAPFQLDVGAKGALTVRADGYTDADRARYAAAFDAILPEAVRLANESRARAQRPRP